MSKKMECKNCHNTEGALKEFPFEIEETLLSDSHNHEDVYIHRCKGCNSLYAGLGVQAFDDNLAYWVQVTDSEINELKTLKDTPEVFEATKKLVESKSSHIYGAFDGKYYFKNEPAVVISGMPAW